MKRLGYIYVSFLVVTLAVVYAVPFDGPDLASEARQRHAAGATVVQPAQFEVASTSVVRPKPAPDRPRLIQASTPSGIAKDDPIYAEVAPLDIEDILRVAEGKFPDVLQAPRPKHRPTGDAFVARVQKQKEGDLLASAVIAALQENVDGLNAAANVAASDDKPLEISGVQLTSALPVEDVPLDTLAPRHSGSVFAVQTAIRPKPRGVQRADLGRTTPIRTGPKRTYVVQPGDTMFSISREFFGNNAKFKDIFEANRDKLANPTDIKIGQVLTIPQG